MPTYIGTGHFFSEAAANRHCDNTALKEGRAVVGLPKTNPGETLENREGRYFIVVPDAAPDTPMLAFLRSCRLDGLTLHVPSERIDPKVYAEAKKALLIFGGKWNTGKQCFFFKKDPTAHIATLLGTGVVVNEKKDRQAYYTPAAVAEVVVDCACLDDHHVVLEPSLGGGALALACLEAGASRVVGYEIDPDEAAVIHDPRIEVTLADFLTIPPPKKKFDRIVMNPPFTRGQAEAHVLHACRFLAAGGRLIAVVPDKDHPKLAHLNPETVERFPAGSFKESGTSVATRVIQILN